MIENFRSIKDRTEVLFDPASNLCALVGPNNAGKSNILTALALVLGIQGGAFGKRDLDETDFYDQDTAQPVGISLHLSSPIIAKNVYKKDIVVEGFRLEAKPYKIGQRKGELHTDHYCFGKNEKGKDESPLKDAESLGGAPKPILPRKHLSAIGIVYVLDPVNLSGFFRMSGRGPLAALLDLYRDDFSKPSNLYPRDVPKDTLQKSAKEAFQDVAQQLSSILRTEKLEEIESSLSRHVAEYLGLRPGAKFGIHLGIPEAEELLDELVQLRIHEDPALRPVNVARVGTGYLSLLRLAVLQSLAEVTDRGNAIFIVEEPEAYLHPHLRRFAYQILRKLADVGDQIFYSTHSEEFVDLRRYQEVVRVTKPGLRTEVFQVPSGTSLSFDVIATKLHGKGNQEIYFAERALLLEGQDDRVVFESLAEKRGIDCDARSISILDCGSKDNIPDYVRLCDALGIGYFAIFDSDAGKPSAAKSSANILNVLAHDPTKYHQLPDTLEAALKTTKQPDNWRHLLSLTTPLTYSQIQATYPDLHSAFEAFVKTI